MGMNVTPGRDGFPDLAFITSIGKLSVPPTAPPDRHREADWRPLMGPTPQGVSFANATTGWIVGTNGLVRRTTDGGAAWTPLDPPFADADTVGVLARDATHLWTWSGRDGSDPGSGYSGGMLARSVDGGATWTVVFRDEAREVHRVFMLNNAEGWMISNASAGPRLEHTTDGGATWTDMPIPSGAMGVPDYSWDVYFFDRCEGLLLVESTDNTLVFYTRDRGATWEDQDLASLRVVIPLPIPIRARLTNFDFASRDDGYAAGFHESLVSYASDGPGPGCGGGIGPGGGADEGCGCRATGQGGSAAGLFCLAAFVAVLVRRRL